MRINHAKRIADLMDSRLDKHLEQLTPWIENELTELFVKSGKSSVTIGVSKLLGEPKIIKEVLQYAGFSVRYVYGDTRVEVEEEDFYVISIPPQRGRNYNEYNKNFK